MTSTASAGRVDGPPSGRPDVRPGLGLALAGGGFRATLFHLGVFRRLAELDLLRRVEMISAVSGGSVVAAHYALLFRRAMGGKAADLAHEEYLRLVDRLEREIVAAVQKNLRFRLLINPLANLAVMLTHRTLGSRMARLYELYLFKPDKDEDGPDERSLWERLRRRRRLLLRDLRVELPDGYRGRGSLARYNAERREQPGGSAVPALVLNATTLNSGGRFTLSASEIGDSKLGTFRHDQIDDLLRRKRWMQDASIEQLTSDLDQQMSTAAEGDPQAEQTSCALALACRLRGADTDITLESDSWGALAHTIEIPTGFAAGPLDLEPLRRARTAANQLLDADSAPEVDRGRTWHDLLDAVRELDGQVADDLAGHAGTDPVARLEVAKLVVELYMLRSAERVSPRIRRDWERLSLGAAVGASAAFPPVFPPVVLTSAYDDVFVTQLGLTDGGVYDNTGMQALVDAGCRQIIASDTGGVFRFQSRVNASRPRMMGRIVPVLREVGSSRQRQALRFRRRTTMEVADAHLPPDHALSAFAEQHGLDALAYFHISSSPVEPGGGPAPLPADPALDRAALADLRTDLDSFGDVEITLLVKHGYDTADRYVRRYLIGSTQGDGSLREYSPPTFDDELVSPDRAARILRAGRSRFFRWLRLLPPENQRSAAVIALLAALVTAGWAGTPLTGALSTIGELAGWVLGHIPAFVAWTLQPLVAAAQWITAPAGQPYSLAVSIILAAGIVALVTWRRRRLPGTLPTGRPAMLRALRWSGRARTVGRGLLGNLLWFAGLAPIVLSLLGSLYAVIGLALNRLFLRLTEDPQPASPPTNPPCE